MTWAEKRRTSVSGGELSFVDAGDGDAPAVVLLSGGFTSSYLWRPLIPLLSPWMRVVAPDLLGSGDSSAARDAELDLRAHAASIRELLDALGIERYAVAGHGHGGGVAQLLAVGDAVDALVLVDAIAFDAWPAAGVRELQARLDALDRDAVESSLAAAFRSSVARRDLSDDELAEYLRPFRGPDGLERLRRVAASFDGEGLLGLERRLAELEVPTLVLWGEEDTFVDVAVAERLGDVLPMVSVAVFPGCGHFLLEDAPEKVAPIAFRWLRTKYLKVEHRHEPDAGPVVVTLGRRPPEPFPA